MDSIDSKPVEIEEISLEGVKAEEVKPLFFTASTNKIAILSICSFGIYEFYWFYKNWVLIKEREEINIWPFWRAAFAVFWAYSCFKYVKSAAGEYRINESLSIGLLAIVYFLLIMASNIPNPLWLISFISFVVMIPVNNVAIELNKHIDPFYEINENYSSWNIIVIILGGILFALSVFGSFLPDAYMDM